MKNVKIACPVLLCLLGFFAFVPNRASAAKEEEGFDNVPKPAAASGPTRGVATHISSSSGSGNVATHVKGGQYTPHAHPNNPTPGRDQINGITASLYRAEHGNNSTNTARPGSSAQR
ncbi:MAG: hypothetical protein U0136_21455 [Bdellovibrionota bacterium]